MFDCILVFEAVYICTPSSRNTGKKNNILFSTADHDSVKKLTSAIRWDSQKSEELKMYDFNRPLEALKMHWFNTGKNKFLQVFGLSHLITLAKHLN